MVRYCIPRPVLECLLDTTDSGCADPGALPHPQTLRIYWDASHLSARQAVSEERFASFKTYLWKRWGSRLQTEWWTPALQLGHEDSGTR